MIPFYQYMSVDNADIWVTMKEINIVQIFDFNDEFQITDWNTPKINTISTQIGLPQSFIDLTGDWKVNSIELQKQICRK